MTKKELLEALEKVHKHAVIVCSDENGGWDNIIEVKYDGEVCTIVWGGGSPFTDEQ